MANSLIVHSNIVLVKQNTNVHKGDYLKQLILAEDQFFFFSS